MFPYKPVNKTHRGGRAVRLFGAVVAAGLVFALTACGGGADTPQAGVPPQEPGPESVNADIEDLQIEPLSGDPEAFAGERVRVKGTVTEVVGTYAFLLGSQKPEVEPLLVVSAEKNVAGKGDVVKVTGKVASGFEVASVEKQLGIDLDDSAFERERFAGLYYIKATKVVPAQ